MWGIAVRYGVAYQELLDANPDIDPDLLWEDQEIAVPVDASSVDFDDARTHTVGEGETVWGIAQRYEIEYQELLRINGMDASSVIRPGDELILPEP
jgi:LysM repeat protein